MANSAMPRGVVRPIRRVLALAVMLVLVGTGLLWVTLQLAGPAPTQEIPWWVLAAAFAATEIWVVHIQFGREAKSISISEIPLVLALFYSTPGDLMLAKIVGPAVVVLFLRRQTAVKSALNLALFYASGSVAVFTFTVIAGGSTADGPREWIAAVAACTLAIVIDLLVLTLILSWYTEASIKQGLRGSWPAVVPPCRCHSRPWASEPRRTTQNVCRGRRRARAQGGQVPALAHALRDGPGGGAREATAR